MIPIRQVRRALATWVAPTGKVSTRSAKAVAQDLLLRFRPLGARRAAWDELLAYVTDVAVTDGAVARPGGFRSTALNNDHVLGLLLRVIPDGASYRNGRVLLGATPEFTAHILTVQLNAIGVLIEARTLDRKGLPTDELLDWLDNSLERSRLICLLNNATSVSTFEQDACLRLLPSLGMELRHPSDNPRQ